MINIKKTAIMAAGLLISIAVGARTKIACVGNSITYGYLIANRELNSYPAQLQYYLGDEYEVENFGVPSKTALSNGDQPYIKTEAYMRSLEYNPDIVLIKLGTNDSKPANRDHLDEFAADYKRLIDSYKSLPSKPRIVLLTPTKSFTEDSTSIDGRVIERRIVPLVEEAAYENGTEIVRLHNMFGDQWSTAIISDKIHPTSIGAGMIARKIGEYITQPVGNDKKIVAAGNEREDFNFHGYRGQRFKLNGVDCRLVSPNVSAEDNPWVLRARFWGHEPQTDIALLEHGFHIAYCDVADLFGSEEAMKRWDAFYDEMKSIGMNEKVVLEGMSRGGLAVYNWAARHPERIACIYADAPVMNLYSWPMSNGDMSRCPDESKNMMKVYGFKSAEDAAKFDNNPIDHASTIAKYGIPVIHVVGDADDVVPVAENTAIFEARMHDAGQDITVIHKPGTGHHPHSLYDPKKIVDFILRSTGKRSKVTTHAVPGNEFRSGAGWTEGQEWHGISQEISETINGRKLKLLLLGNSITQGWGGSRKSVTYKPGQKAMDRTAGVGNWESAGISGDRTENLLWRVRNCEYEKCQPENIVIAIGINNLIAGDEPEDVADGIIAVAKESRSKFADARILLLGLYPSGLEPDSDIRKKCDRIHEILAATEIAGVDYENPTGWLTDSNGRIGEGLYSPDYIHLSEKGYEVVAKGIKKWMGDR